MKTQGEERRRLRAQRDGGEDWHAWGPYLSERQWGTVREDYSPDGKAWEYFPHDHARSRAYRWGEDGIAGLSDADQSLCLGLALWNGRDPILKERLFGLANGEGNHGEDVKELYYYLDASPSHAYLKMLYTYPHSEYPYARLVRENRTRGREAAELEVLDTGVFDNGRYFDVFVEYAQAAPGEVLMRITAYNRGASAEEVHLVPQLWFRNTWSWHRGPTKPHLAMTPDGGVEAKHPQLGALYLRAEGEPELLFCDNETNVARLYGVDGGPAYPKDAIHARVVLGRNDAVNPARSGTKFAAWYRTRIAPGEAFTARLRLSPGAHERSFDDFDEMVSARRRETDEYYAELQEDIELEDERRVQRQAFAGMVWTKQLYRLDVPRWLDGDEEQPPPPPSRRNGRNREWRHLNNADVISMPDKWEYPWYAAWDLAFHCIPFALVDPEFAKRQLVLLTREWYMHPNGQLPAYEWDFGDVNPPVHAWAAWRVYQIDRTHHRGGEGDRLFLERVFHKLLLNFTWWVNRKDVEGHNIFRGGFLGLDNIGVFDRSAPLPTGGHINQADGTSWMAMYCLNLMRIALELARENPAYQDIATKFFEHFLHIAEAMSNIGDRGIGLWDETDGFFYDELRLPDASIVPLKVRSMVGLIPLFAVEVLEPEMLDELPEFARRLQWFLDYRPDLAALVSRWHEPGRGHRRLLALLRGHRMKRVLARMLDEAEFLSPYGIRALSRHHLDAPYVFDCLGERMSVEYEPAESRSGLFGGNSNWRGPVWFPVNYLIIESLQRFHHYYGDDFAIECPTGSGRYTTINGVAEEISRRLCRIFLLDANGERPLFGHHPRMQHDPLFRDRLLFYEYFHGDTGRGAGASHQTGWTGLVAKLLQPRRAPE